MFYFASHDVCLNFFVRIHCRGLVSALKSIFEPGQRAVSVLSHAKALQWSSHAAPKGDAEAEVAGTAAAVFCSGWWRLLLLLQQP